MQKEPDMNGFDPTFLESMASIAPDRVARFIELTRKDAVDYMQKIEEAIASQDAETIEESAHSLKSVSGQVGALRFSDMAKELEIMGRENKIEGAKEKLEELKKEYTNIEVILTTMY